MAVTLPRSVFGLCSISSFSRERFHDNTYFCCSKPVILPRTSTSKYRVMAIKSDISMAHEGVRKKRKNKNEEGDGETVTKLVEENPYTEMDTAGPDVRKKLSDFFEEAKDFVEDGGPPRWFSPLECGAQAPRSPLFLYIPGIDGTGLGLIGHHKKLGGIFDIWCLHIPAKDRTPAKGSFVFFRFSDLVKLIEKTVRSENNRFPKRPIYLVGEAIGACLALDVAARNPNIDLAMILANPATNVNNFTSLPLAGMLNVIPDGTPTLLEEIFGFKQGDPLTSMLDTLTNEFSVQQMSGVGGGMLRDIFAVSTNLPTLSRIFPKDTLLWKLELLKSAIASANSHIYSVKADTLILLSGRDQWLLKEEEIDRFPRILPNCLVRKLNDNGQFLFFEDNVDLVTIIKANCFYRRGKSHDHISDYILPTPFELKQLIDEHRYIIYGTSPVTFSTLGNGKVVRGLEGLPSEGPVLYFGYHMLLGFELGPLMTHMLKERNIHLRGLAHPMLFVTKHDLVDPQLFDKYKIMGGVPASSFSIYKLLSSKRHVLLYPGGVREALHNKGEEYKLFWPEQADFVRVASKFGAKIVPFGVVGEDDICEIFLDANDQRKIPILKDFMEKATKKAGNLREGDKSKLEIQDCYMPGLVPKIPGRFYFYFGKPIETAGKEQELRDKDKAQELYLQIKYEVEQCLEYLKTKRESDPYRNFLPRMFYQATHGGSSEIPTFDI